MIFTLISCSSLNLTNNYYNKFYSKNCIKTNGYKIFQVIDDGALTSECDDKYSKYCSRKTVFLSNRMDIEYYDDMRIDIKKNICVMIDGTYKYETKSGNYKTIPSIIIFNKTDDIIEFKKDAYNYYFFSLLDACYKLSELLFPKENHKKISDKNVFV